jgi:hypothetical protein
MKSKLGDTFAPMLLVDKDAGYAPQPFVFRQRFDFLVVAASIDSWKLSPSAILGNTRLAFRQNKLVSRAIGPLEQDLACPAASLSFHR